MSSKNLPTPNFTRQPRICQPIINCISGLRPWRARTYRLEAEEILGQTIIHNYGHGGAGITMSWGCAYEVLDIVSSRLLGPRDKRVAVLGAGIMGLTSATLLVDAGYEVMVYAKSLPPNTTSNIAGGQWSPSVVQLEDNFAGKRQFHRILRRAFAAFESRLGSDFGVYRRKNYTHNIGSFSKIPSDIVPEPKRLDRLPFRGHTIPGYVFETLLIEPPIMLDKLLRDLRARGIKFITKEFHNAAELQSLPFNTVVNSTGLGAKEIFSDPLMVPLKGDLVLLPPQSNLDYLYSAGRNYIFPRTDAVVLGGSFEDEFDDTKPDCDLCNTILDQDEALFDPKRFKSALYKDQFSYSVRGQKFFDL